MSDRTAGAYGFHSSMPVVSKPKVGSQVAHTPAVVDLSGLFHMWSRTPSVGASLQ